eukprot:901246-Prymnesium_polylepis.1
MATETAARARLEPQRRLLHSGGTWRAAFTASATWAYDFVSRRVFRPRHGSAISVRVDVARKLCQRRLRQAR